MSYRIVCASDGHGARSAREALVCQMPACDLFCYLGDVESDALYFRAALAQVRPAAAFLAVAGNCDPFSALALTVRHQAAGVRLLATHGHLFSVKQTLDLLAQAALDNGCVLALFGHTHIPCCQWQGGVLLFNPGALRQGQWGVVEIGEKGEISGQLRTLPA